MHPTDDLAWLNVAIPDEAPEGRRVPILGEEAKGAGALSDEDPAQALHLVKDHFLRHRRAPRVELVAEAFPQLPALLEAAGFREASRLPAYACTRASWQAAPVVPGLRLEPILPGTPWKTTRRFLLVQREAFGLREPIPERAPPDLWDALGLAAGLLAFLHEAPVAAGGLLPASDGLAEIVDLGTLPAARGRGVATMLASGLARVALDTGADAALALPADDAARRVCERAGFRKVATIADWRA